jgi:hypothetical protein
MSPKAGQAQSRMQKGWRNTPLTVGKMTSSAKKGLFTLAGFRVKRKTLRENRHVRK